MAAVSNQQVVDLFKKVYGDLHNLLPQDYPLAKEIPFSEGRRVGDSFVEAFVLSNESGITLAGTGQDAFDINPAIAGAVKQTTVIPSQTVMSSVIPFAFITRSAGGGERAFFDGTKHVMQNHIRSHSRFLEEFRLYGQSSALMGYVSFAPTGTVYRGATYTGTGDVTLTRADGTTIVFTDGINVASKAILLAPGEFAAGLWIGLEGANVKQINNANVVVAEGKLVSVDSGLGILFVDFIPVAPTAATGAGSLRMGFDGEEYAKEMIGIHRILTNTGALFGISAAQYSLWRANTINVGGKRFDLKAMQIGIAEATNSGGLERPLTILVNPRTFANMSNDEASLRKYDASYKSGRANNGFETIEYYAANGLNSILPHRMVKEGHAFGLCFEDWIRSGSAEISFKIPGIDKEVIFPLENQAGWVVRSFSDQYIMCRAPSKQVLWYNINDEGVSY